LLAVVVVVVMIEHPSLPTNKTEAWPNQGRHILCRVSEGPKTKERRPKDSGETTNERKGLVVFCVSVWKKEEKKKRK
jgi:hypothetical protein